VAGASRNFTERRCIQYQRRWSEPLGKSTLINALFQGDFAHTGQGRPVTSSTKEFTKEGSPLHLFDTRGLEMDQYERTVKELNELIRSRRREKDPSNHLHVAWVCIAEDSRRVEEAESKLVEMFDSSDLPTIGVITKARSDRGFRAEVVRLLPGARNVLRVRAIPEELDDGHTLAMLGLQDLAALTFELLPEGQRSAFAAAQKANIGLKKEQARRVVVASAALAAGIGAAPIPFSDAIALVPIEVAMLARISAVFGLSFGEGALSTIISSAFTALGATALGRSIVTGILKLVPGVNLAAGLVAGVTAAAMTTTFGEMYIAVLAALFEKSDGEPPTADDVAKAISEALLKRAA